MSLYPIVNAAQPVGSLEIAEWPVSGMARTWAFGYWAAVRRASSSGVRRSSRPETTSTRTSGPVDGTPAGLGVDGQSRHIAAVLNESTAAGENGAHAEAGRALIAAASAAARPLVGEAGSHGRRSSTQSVASSRIGLNSLSLPTSDVGSPNARRRSGAVSPRRAAAIADGIRVRRNGSRSLTAVSA